MTKKNKAGIVSLLFLSIISGATRLSFAKSDIVLSEPLTVRWRYESNITLNLTPAADVERIYLPLAGGVVVALRAKDGQLFWRSEIGGELSASPAADDEQVYVASETGSTENSPRRATGVLRALGREGGV